jgi:hypothetical protein
MADTPVYHMGTTLAPLTLGTSETCTDFVKYAFL